MLSYVNDFSLTVASPSQRSNLWRLQAHFLNISRKASEPQGLLPFAANRTLPLAGIQQKDHSLPRPYHPRSAGLLPSRGGKMAGLLAITRTQYLPPFQQPPGPSQRLLLLHQTPLLLARTDPPLPRPPCRYGALSSYPKVRANLLVPNHRTTASMNSFWHRVCRWVTNNLYSTPTAILTREACLSPIDLYCRHRRRLAALRIACAPPTHNPAAA